MIGVPFKIWIDGEQTTIYLSTARSGEKGAAIQAARTKHYKLVRDTTRALQRIRKMAFRAQVLESKDADLDVIEALFAEQIDLNDKADDLARQAGEAALAVVRRALEANYGVEQAEYYIDRLTDRQIGQLVTVLETGEVPEDFFPCPDTQPKLNSTSPERATTGGSCSTEDSAVEISPLGG